MAVLLWSTFAPAQAPPALPTAGFCHMAQLYAPAYPAHAAQANRIYSLPNGDYLLAGTWNRQAYLMRLDAEGAIQHMATFEPALGFASALHDVEPTAEGGFVLTGTYAEQSGADTIHGVFVLKVGSDLVPDTATGIKKFHTDHKRSPRLCSAHGGGFLLAATNGNLVLTRLSDALDSLWSTFHNLGISDVPAEIVPTQQGYAVPLNNATLVLLPSVLMQVDSSGQQLWATVLPAGSIRALRYSNQTQQILCVGTQATNLPSGQDIALYAFDALTGQLENSKVLPGTPNRDIGESIQLLQNGNLLLGARENISFGSAERSTIYRLHGSDWSAIDSLHIRYEGNPYGIGLLDLKAEGCDGRSFALVGYRKEATYVQAFFYRSSVCDTAILATHTALCPGDTIVLALPGGADAFMWSTGDTTPQLSIAQAGLYALSWTTDCTSFSDSLLIEAQDTASSAFTYEQDGLSVTFASADTSGTHLWHFGDGHTSTLAHPAHTYAGGGSYSVLHTVENACGSSSTEKAVVLTTSAVQPSDSPTFAVFPVPFSDRLWVRFHRPSLSEGRWEAQLRTLRHRTVRTRTLGTSPLAFSTSDLPAGIYILCILHEAELVYRRVVLKSN